MKIKVLPENVEIEARAGHTLIEIFQEHNIPVKSTCKGIMSCADCRVRIVDGDYNVMPPKKGELNMIGTNYFIDGRRLACQVRVFGPVTVDISEQLERSEAANKKIRGFRSTQNVTESKAVQDTFILDKKDEGR